MRHITLKRALATPCKCGGMPKLGEPEELWILVCEKCGAESLSGCRRHYATDTWHAWNKGAKNTQQQVQPDSELRSKK